MMHDHTHSLIEAWLDGVIDDVGLAELEVAILESGEVRREFWRRASLHGMLHEAAKVAFAAGAAEPDGRNPSAGGTSGIVSRRSGGESSSAARVGWLRGGVAVGVALLVVSGCGIGSVVTSLAFAYAGMLGRAQPAVVVHEEGFEHPPAPDVRHIPDRLDLWSGDETVVVGAEHGIVPRSGDKMLKFLSPRPQGAVYPGLASEIWRVIDLESLRAAAGSRDLRVDFSACFNGCAGRGEPRKCWISAIATDTHPRDLGDDWEEQFDAAHKNPCAVATAQVRERMDTDPETWQRFSVTVTAPPGARYLLLHCLTEYRPDEDQDIADRCGQYVDDISVAVSAIDTEVMAVATHARESRR